MSINEEGEKELDYNDIEVKKYIRTYFRKVSKSNVDN